MAEKQLRSEQMLSILAGNSARIATLTAGLAPEQLRASLASGEWSLNDILAHLRSCADVWGNCIEIIIAQDMPTIRAINPTTWIDRTNYREQAFEPSFGAFIAQRDALLATLQPLQAEAWTRSATITGAGKPLVRTVHFYAQWLARHERSHLKEIERVAAAVRL